MKRYNPEYYATPDAPTSNRDLYEGEVNVVDNINNESKNKASIIKADEDNFTTPTVNAPRDFYPGEINVVDNIENREDIKKNIIKSPEADNETVDKEVYYNEYR